MRPESPVLADTGLWVESADRINDRLNLRRLAIKYSLYEGALTYFQAWSKSDAHTAVLSISLPRVLGYF